MTSLALIVDVILPLFVFVADDQARPWQVLAPELSAQRHSAWQRHKMLHLGKLRPYLKFLDCGEKWTHGTQHNVAQNSS
jgi:hypothetical protein